MPSFPGGEGGLVSFGLLEAVAYAEVGKPAVVVVRRTCRLCISLPQRLLLNRVRRYVEKVLHSRCGRVAAGSRNQRACGNGIPYSRRVA